MPHGLYPDTNRFLRAVRVLPVLAGAALIGGMIGGFAVFAIDSALTWKPATWEPTSQSRSDVRADNQSAVEQQPTKPVRIVGGAIPDPSAGMSGPPPVQQPAQQRPAIAQPQLPAQVLTPNSLGPALPLQTEAATAVPTPRVQQQPQTQTASQTANQNANQPENAAVTQQPTRWPDALSRADQSAASAQRQIAPPPANAQAPNAQTADRTTSRNSEAPAAARAAGTDDQGRFGASRRGRHERRHMTITTNAPRGEDVPAQQDARSYSRIYDSYGGGREQDMEGVEPRFDMQRRFARDPRYRSRSRGIVRVQPEEADRAQQRMQLIEAPPPRRPEPF
jgi:hypothetical protein